MDESSLGSHQFRCFGSQGSEESESEDGGSGVRRRRSGESEQAGHLKVFFRPKTGGYEPETPIYMAID